MYTLVPNYYMEKAVFREDTFYLIPKDKLTYIVKNHEKSMPRIFHWCPDLAKYQQDHVGIIFLIDDIEKMECDRCHKSPGDDIVTVYTMLKEK